MSYRQSSKSSQTVQRRKLSDKEVRGCYNRQPGEDMHILAEMTELACPITLELLKLRNKSTATLFVSILLFFGPRNALSLPVDNFISTDIKNIFWERHVLWKPGNIFSLLAAQVGTATRTDGKDRDRGGFSRRNNGGGQGSVERQGATSTRKTGVIVRGKIYCYSFGGGAVDTEVETRP